MLTDISPSPDTFNPATDDFNLLLASDTSNFDTLQALLDSQTDGPVAATQDISSTLDTMGSIFDGIDGTFSALDSSLSQLNYENEIADTMALDKSFESNVAGWAPDLADAAIALIAAIAKEIAGLINSAISGVIGITVGLIAQVNSQLEGQINLLYGMIESIGIPPGEQVYE